MLEELYLKSIEKKEEINEFFDSIPEKIDIELVESKYQNHTFNKEIQEKNFAAIDGSFNKTKFMAAQVYAITSQTILSMKNCPLEKESKAADINVISTTYNQRIDKILSTDMNILELKSTINTLRKHDDLDYMLLDGSLRGTLMNYKPEYDLPPEIRRLLSYFYKTIEEEFYKDRIELEIIVDKNKTLIRTECEKALLNSETNIEDVEMDILMYLKGIEQLFCIYYLLKDFKNKIICVSKTSSTKSLFNQYIPDAAVIEYTCNESGYSDTIEYTSNKIVRYIANEKRIINFPVKNRELSEICFNVCFTKLEDKSNVLKIEVPYKLKDKKHLISILNDLKSISVNGYPHILKKAHDEVKIGTDFMKRINRNMGLYEKNGRDMLN